MFVLIIYISFIENNIDTYIVQYCVNLTVNLIKKKKCYYFHLKNNAYE